MIAGSQARVFVACASIIVQLTSQREFPSVFERSGVDSGERIKTVVWTRFRLQGKSMPLKLISVTGL